MPSIWTRGQAKCRDWNINRSGSAYCGRCEMKETRAPAYCGATLSWWQSASAIERKWQELHRVMTRGQRSCLAEELGHCLLVLSVANWGRQGQRREMAGSNGSETSPCPSTCHWHTEWDLHATEWKAVQNTETAPLRRRKKKDNALSEESKFFYAITTDIFYYTCTSRHKPLGPSCIQHSRNRFVGRIVDTYLHAMFCMNGQ